MSRRFLALCVRVPLISVVLFMMSGVFASDTGNVFSDAVFWFSGVTDDAGNGFLNQGEFRDVRYASPEKRDHWLNRSYRAGYNNDAMITITNMTVVSPNACVTNHSCSCVYLHQPLEDPKVADPKLKAAGIRLPDLFTMGYSSNVTVVMRFRLEELIRKDGSAFLFCIGHGQKTHDLDNCGLGLRILSNGRLQTYFSTGESVNHSIDEAGSNAIRSNVWVDVAFTMGNGRITTYRAMEDYSGGYWVKHYASIPSKAANTNSVGNGFSIGLNGISCVNGARTYSSYKSIWSSFRGQIQQYAIWNRTLSDHEVAEAFGCKAEKLRLGVPNGSSGEFCGTEVAADAAGKTEDWRMLAPCLTESNPTLTLNFNVEEHETELPLILNVLSTPDSSDGDVKLVVNGETVRAHHVKAGDGKNFFIKKSLLSEGANSLSISWLGAGTFHIDAITLGGSWRLGLKDGKTDGFAKANRYRKTYYKYGAQTWGTRLNRTISSSSNYEDLTIVFPMTAAMTSSRYELEIPLRKTTSQEDAIDVKISVNGVEKNVFPVSSRSYSSLDVYKLTLSEGELVSGANTIRLDNMYESAGAGIAIDCIELRAVRPDIGTRIFLR